MANEVTKKAAGAVALPHDFAKRLAQGIAQSHTQMRQVGGKPFLRLLKSGEWVYGAEDVEVQPGSIWGVNVVEMKHGWCCWVDHGAGQKNTLDDEIMVSVLDDKPPCPPPLNGSPYAEQYSFELKCLTGEDEGTEVLYKTASLGGTRAFRALTTEIMKRAAAENPFLFPAIALDMDYYEHNKYGRTYIPVFTVSQWADMEGNIEEAPVAEIEPPAEASPPPAPTKARTRPVAEQVKPARKAVEEPVSTTQARAGQRRRPSR